MWQKIAGLNRNGTIFFKKFMKFCVLTYIDWSKTSFCVIAHLNQRTVAKRDRH